MEVEVDVDVARSFTTSSNFACNPVTSGRYLAICLVATGSHDGIEGIGKQSLERVTSISMIWYHSGNVKVVKALGGREVRKVIILMTIVKHLERWILESGVSECTGNLGMGVWTA